VTHRTGAPGAVPRGLPRRVRAVPPERAPVPFAVPANSRRVAR
jgi:hypothetical protein